jgi:citrate lyase subunit beta/citryl-CoA lyase
LQAELIQEFGACVFDVTLDCEDGARVGAEHDHAAVGGRAGARGLRGARRDIQRGPAEGRCAGASGATILCSVTRYGPSLPVQGATCATSWCPRWSPSRTSIALPPSSMPLIDSGRSSLMPVHVLLESPAAVHRAFDIAAHPRVESISFGLMDFVSAHGGAIPATAMSQAGQFAHPLVVRAKLEIASACHAHGKVPSHCVVTEFRDEEVRSPAPPVPRPRNSATPGCGASIRTQIRTILAAICPAATRY